MELVVNSLVVLGFLGGVAVSLILIGVENLASPLGYFSQYWHYQNREHGRLAVTVRKR